MQFDKVKEEHGKPEPTKRLMLIKFFRQAKLFDKAEKEIERMEADLPKAKVQIDEAREQLKQSQIETWLEEVNAAQASGQPRLAQAFLQKIPNGAGGALNVQIVAARVK